MSVMKIAPPSLTIDDVRAAAARIAGEVGETPCLASRTLSQICGCAVFLKFENLQFTASFKERGALNKMAQLTAAERAKGVLAVSAGNHAQAVAYHAAAHGHRGDDRHAALRVEREGREHARLRRRGRPRRRHLRGRARRRPEARRGARLHGRPSVRRPRGDRRPGHGRARDARRAARRSTPSSSPSAAAA